MCAPPVAEHAAASAQSPAIRPTLGWMRRNMLLSVTSKAGGAPRRGKVRCAGEGAPRLAFVGAEYRRGARGSHARRRKTRGTRRPVARLFGLRHRRGRNRDARRRGPLEIVDEGGRVEVRVARVPHGEAEGDLVAALHGRLRGRASASRRRRRSPRPRRRSPSPGAHPSRSGNRGWAGRGSSGRFPGRRSRTGRSGAGSQTSKNPRLTLTGLCMLSKEMLPWIDPAGAGLTSAMNWSL